MKKHFKLVITVLLIAIITSLCALPVSAATEVTKSETRSSAFSNKWEKSTFIYENGIYIGRMVWGYDTRFINEDFAWTTSPVMRTTASVKRDGIDTGYVSGPRAEADNYSKREVRHACYLVYYRLTFAITYFGTITHNTIPSNVKI
ncbi:MAG TPA: hypothetical protein VFC76_02390 [Oscillospiraceae bacterium]|nr:hypothetical protein [Oscillospiraceae bacterium]